MWSEEAFKLLDYPRDILGKGPHTTGAPPPPKKYPEFYPQTLDFETIHYEKT